MLSRPQTIILSNVGMVYWNTNGYQKGATIDTHQWVIQVIHLQEDATLYYHLKILFRKMCGGIVGSCVLP